MWIKALLAVVPAALFLAAPAPVAHADGACTALAGGDGSAYYGCTKKMDVSCKYSGGFYVEVHVACAYPDGGRDDCVEHLDPSPFGGAQIIGHTCTYVSPGYESTPAAGTETAPAGEPS